MKLEARTVTILKNFTAINNSLAVKSGNKIATINEGKNIMAQATVKDSFDKPFAVYDLSRFLATLSLFNEPHIKFGDQSMKISDGSKSVTYVYCDPEFILSPEQEKLDAVSKTESDIEVELTAENLQSIMKASSVMKLPNIGIEGDGQNLIIRAFVARREGESKITDDFHIVLGSTDKVFNAVFKTENFKMIFETYSVKVTKRLAEFASSDVTYWIAVEKELSSI